MLKKMLETENSRMFTKTVAAIFIEFFGFPLTDFLIVFVVINDCGLQSALGNHIVFPDLCFCVISSRFSDFPQVIIVSFAIPLFAEIRFLSE